MLLVEREAPAVYYNSRFFVDCARLSLPAGSSGVSATVTYSFNFIGYDCTMISDHSGKYYAAYFREPNPGLSPGPEVIQVWDIEAGKLIQRIDGPFFRESPGVNLTDVMVVAKQGSHGPQQVVIAGSNHSSNRSSDSENSGSWSSLTELKAFPIGDGPPGWDGYVKHAQRCRASIFKLPRSPAGIGVVDDPAAPEYEGEKIGLAFFGVDDSSGVAISSYHNFIPDELAGLSRVPLTAHGESHMYYQTAGGQIPAPFFIQRRSGLSFTLNHPSRAETRGPSAPRRPHSYKYVTLRSFSPSAAPGLMELEWETYARFRNDGKQLRDFYRDLGGRPPPFKDICGDEFVTAFPEPREDQLYLVLAVWDEPFQEE